MAATEEETGGGTPTTAEQVAKGLGWFSIGLGAAELVFPGALGRMFGLGNREGLIRAYGAREIAAGVGVLSGHPAPAMWARAGGDLVDLATLAVGLRAEGDERRNAALAIAAVAGITIVDLLVAVQLSKEAGLFGEAEGDREQPSFPAGLRVGRDVEDPAAADADREPALATA